MAMTGSGNMAYSTGAMPPPPAPANMQQPAGQAAMPPPPAPANMQQPAGQPPGAMNQGPYSPWDNAGTNSFFSQMSQFANPQGANDWQNQYGGQQIAGADPSQADYGSVQNYADAAHENAMRYLEPQQAQQNRRMQQELINKGIDPNSAQGQEMQNMLAMQQGDAQNAAAFNALGFGQGIQNQMAQQEQAKAGLAGQMEMARNQNQLGWGNVGLGMGQLGLGYGNLDLQRGMGEHTQLMDSLGYDMDVYKMNQSTDLIQDALFNSMYGSTPVPGFGPTNPYGIINTMLGAGSTTWGSAGANLGKT